MGPFRLGLISHLYTEKDSTQGGNFQGAQVSGSGLSNKAGTPENPVVRQSRRVVRNQGGWGLLHKDKQGLEVWMARNASKAPLTSHTKN